MYFALTRWPELDKAIWIAATLAAALVASFLVNRLVIYQLRRIARRHPGVQVSGLMRNVVRLIIFMIGLLVVLPSLGVQITGMLAAFGVGGLAVALALQEPLSNLFAGLFVTVAGQIRIGDYIKLEPGPEGFVADFRWNATTLTTLAGNIVIVPNAKLAQALVTNFNRPTSDTGVGVELTVAPGSDLATVERVALDAANAVTKDVPGGVPGAETSVRFIAFSDLGIKVGVNVRTREYGEQGAVRHELIKRLQKGLADAGVEIATVANWSQSRVRGPESSVRP